MYEIKIDRLNAIVGFVLEGTVRMDEMNRFVRELQEATHGLRGSEIKIKADVRALRPAAPEVAEMIRGVQEFGIRSGVKRVAEIVESDIIALQLNRVAHESGTDRILRRFWEEDSAREWLIHGDPIARAPRSGPMGRDAAPASGRDNVPVSGWDSVPASDRIRERPGAPFHASGARGYRRGG